MALCMLMRLKIKKSRICKCKRPAVKRAFYLNSILILRFKSLAVLSCAGIHFNSVINVNEQRNPYFCT